MTKETLEENVLRDIKDKIRWRHDEQDWKREQNKAIARRKKAAKLAVRHKPTTIPTIKSSKIDRSDKNIEKDWGGNVRVLKNPTADDFDRLYNRTNQGVRVLWANGDWYVWDAETANHTRVFNALGIDQGTMTHVYLTRDRTPGSMYGFKLSNRPEHRDLRHYWDEDDTPRIGRMYVSSDYFTRGDLAWFRKRAKKDHNFIKMTKNWNVVGVHHNGDVVGTAKFRATRSKTNYNPRRRMTRGELSAKIKRDIDLNLAESRKYEIVKRRRRASTGSLASHTRRGSILDHPSILPRKKVVPKKKKVSKPPGWSHKPAGWGVDRKSSTSLVKRPMPSLKSLKSSSSKRGASLTWSKFKQPPTNHSNRIITDISKYRSTKVYKNPDVSEFDKLIKSGDGVRILRANGDWYVWSYDEFVHTEVIEKLGLAPENMDMPHVNAAMNRVHNGMIGIALSVMKDDSTGQTVLIPESDVIWDMSWVYDELKRDSKFKTMTKNWKVLNVHDGSKPSRKKINIPGWGMSRDELSAKIRRDMRLNLSESITRKDFEGMLKRFIDFTVGKLNIVQPPKVEYKSPEDQGEQPSFGGYCPETKKLIIVTKNRHPLDVFRSTAHELVHHKQNEDGKLGKNIRKEGETGSDIENEANSMAGVIMRHYGKENPQMFSHTHITEQKKAPTNINHTVIVGSPEWMSMKKKERRSLFGTGDSKSFRKTSSSYEKTHTMTERDINEKFEDMLNEVGGAGNEGTPLLTAAYMRDTPGQDIGFGQMKVLKLKKKNKKSSPIASDRLGSEYGYPKSPTMGDNQTLDLNYSPMPMSVWTLQEKFQRKYGPLWEEKLARIVESLDDPYSPTMGVSPNSWVQDEVKPDPKADDEKSSLFGKKRRRKQLNELVRAKLFHKRKWKGAVVFDTKGHTYAPKSPPIKTIPISDIKASWEGFGKGHDTPESSEHTTTMADKIRKGVKMPPVLVRRNPRGLGYELVDGNHRYQAFLDAGKKTIDVQVIPPILAQGKPRKRITGKRKKL